MAGGGSATLDQILPARLDSARRSGGRPCKTGLRMTETPGSTPPIGYARARESLGNGLPKQSRRHPERSEGSDIPASNPILAAGAISVRMTQDIVET